MANPPDRSRLQKTPMAIPPGRSRLQETRWARGWGGRFQNENRALSGHVC